MGPRGLTVHSSESRVIGTCQDAASTIRALDARELREEETDLSFLALDGTPVRQFR